MNLRKGDTVLVISGKDRGKKGKIITVLPQENRIIVEGINLRKKHLRPKREGEKGQVVEIAAPLNVSNVKLICSKCKMPTRIGHKVVGNGKYRICKKCNQEMD